MPKVSVCIPTYNAARFIAETLESALGQTYGDLEVLVVDDGSTDETPAIAGRYAERDARIRIHRNPANLGLPGNWDRARELATGEWIMFLFQDDLFAPDCVEQMVEAVTRWRVPLACCRREFAFFPEVPEEARESFLGYIRGQDFASRFPGKDFVSAAEFSAQLTRTPVLNFVGEPTCVILHRDALAEFGRFHAQMIQLVDLEYWARIATLRGIAYVDRPLITFRVHGKSATRSNAANAVRKDRLDSVILLHEFLFAPQYRALRRSMRNRTLLWRHYRSRVAGLKLPAGAAGRDPQDPSWEVALSVYPELDRSGWAGRVGEALYGMERQLRRLIPSQLKRGSR